MVPADNRAEKLLDRCEGVPFDPHRFRAIFPDQWMGFLHAHHRSVEEVAFFYGVTHEAARKWWNGAGGPSGAQVAMAYTYFPADAARALRAA